MATQTIVEQRLRNLSKLEHIIARAFHKRAKPHDIPRVLLEPFEQILAAVCKDILCGQPEEVKTSFGWPWMSDAEKEVLRRNIQLSNPKLLDLVHTAWQHRHPACLLFGPFQTIRRFTQLFEAVCRHRKVLWFFGLPTCWHVAQPSEPDRADLLRWIAAEIRAFETGALMRTATAAAKWILGNVAKSHPRYRFWLAAEGAAYGFRLVSQAGGNLKQLQQYLKHDGWPSQWLTTGLVFQQTLWKTAEPVAEAIATCWATTRSLDIWKGPSNGKTRVSSTTTSKSIESFFTLEKPTKQTPL